jgi:hypothetical protein
MDPPDPKDWLDPPETLESPDLKEDKDLLVSQSLDLADLKVPKDSLDHKVLKVLLLLLESLDLKDPLDLGE